MPTNSLLVSSYVVANISVHYIQQFQLSRFPGSMFLETWKPAKTSRNPEYYFPSYWWPPPHLSSPLRLQMEVGLLWPNIGSRTIAMQYGLQQVSLRCQAMPSVLAALQNFFCRVSILVWWQCKVASCPTLFLSIGIISNPFFLSSYLMLPILIVHAALK